MNRLAYVTINFSELLDRRMTLEDEFWNDSWNPIRKYYPAVVQMPNPLLQNTIESFQFQMNYEWIDCYVFGVFTYRSIRATSSPMKLFEVLAIQIHDLMNGYIDRASTTINNHVALTRTNI